MNNEKDKSDLMPGFMFEEEARDYMRASRRALPLWRKLGILKALKHGRSYVYRREWLDSFADEWRGYDLSNETAVLASIALKEWRNKHERI